MGTNRWERIRSNIAEIIDVTRIGMAFQNGRITADEASVAISRVGRSQQQSRLGDQLEAREYVDA